MTSITIKEYVAHSGSLYSDKDAKVIGPVLTELAEHGGVTTRDVVDAARSQNSPLHRYFEWDDKIAADKFRLETARAMLANIRVRYIDGDEQPREARAFQVTRKALYDHEPRKYRTFQVLHGDSAFAAQMMENALDDLVRWRARYTPYTDMWIKFGDLFQQVINQIGELEYGVKSQSTAEETDNALARLLDWKAEFQDALATWTSVREEVQYIMEAIGTAEAAFCKLKQKSTKRCIKCGDDFLTLDEGLRTCPKCRQSLTYKTAGQRLQVAEPPAAISSGNGSG